MDIALRQVSEGVEVPDDLEYIALVNDILEHPSFQSMKSYVQHGTTSCLSHCIAVSYRSYLTCLEYGLDARAAARAGLLHDFFLYDWHSHYKETGNRFHGLTHPRCALENALEEFELSEKEQEIILKHMWPLTIAPPKHMETYVVVYHDKVCSLRETFGRPVFAG